MKKILITVAFALITLSVFSQGYGTIQYMGKKININSEFFGLLNAYYEYKIYHIPYPPKKTQKIYYTLVDFMKKNSTIIYVDEAKRISWHGDSNLDFPYCIDCKSSKRDKSCSSYLLYYVLLPVVEDYIPILKKRGVY
jgi:hypothetical protein